MIEEKKEKIITDVWESDEEFRREILHHITLIDQLAAAKVAVRGDRTTTASEAAVPR
jgi:hypothetical protein